MSREQALELRCLELEAALRKAGTDCVRCAGTEDRTHVKLRVAVNRISDLTEENLDLRERLAAVMAVAIILEGECDECPEDGFHDSYPYRDGE